MKPKKNLLIIYIFISTICIYSCKKLVNIPPPTNIITTSQVFATDAQATEAMAGVYYNMITTNPDAFNSNITFNCGASADEFKFYTTYNTEDVQIMNNSLLSTNSTIALLWNQIYFSIYGCNSVIEGLQATQTVHDSVKTELTGEAEFVRAYANFYLVNLYGRVPLVTTIDYNKTSLLANSPASAAYAAILADLKDASAKLPADYSAGNGQRIVPNKWAAIALLARVYLYQGDWADAATEASLLLNNNSLYALSPLNGAGEVFTANSTEAIWQLQHPNALGNAFNGTPEGNAIIPPSSTSPPPNIYITPALISAFENGDQRRSAWVDSTIFNGIKYYYPYKYKIQTGVPNGPPAENYMVLRLAEQYLIRAEAEAHGAGSGLSGAIADLNVIRNRAGLANYAGDPTDATDVLNAIYHEDQIEFFAEWGHRWFDLKRWATALQVLSADKGFTVKSNQLLYPIYFTELQKDPNLVQNPGY